MNPPLGGAAEGVVVCPKPKEGCEGADAPKAKDAEGAAVGVVGTGAADGAPPNVNGVEPGAAPALVLAPWPNVNEKPPDGAGAGDGAAAAAG